MLIDTRQIVTKTRFRQKLTELLMLVEQGGELVVSDRGEFIAKVAPMKKKKQTGNVSQFMAEVRQLREKLSKQNPGFDSVKALREMREES